MLCSSCHKLERSSCAGDARFRRAHLIYILRHQREAKMFTYESRRVEINKCARTEIHLRCSHVQPGFLNQRGRNGNYIILSLPAAHLYKRSISSQEQFDSTISWICIFAMLSTHHLHKLEFCLEESSLLICINTPFQTYSPFCLLSRCVSDSVYCKCPN